MSLPLSLSLDRSFVFLAAVTAFRPPQPCVINHLPLYSQGDRVRGRRWLSSCELFVLLSPSLTILTTFNKLNHSLYY